MNQDKRIDVRSKARLRWFLDFLYVDIDSLPRADFFKLLVELGSMIRKAEFSLLGSPEIPWGDSEEMRQDIKEYQRHAKENLEVILCLAKGERAFLSLEEVCKLDWNDPNTLQKLGISETMEMSLRVVVEEDRVGLAPTDDRDALTYALIEALNPFSLNDIRKCEREDCGRYFLKATKKEKHYCSNKCAWVMASRKRRENNAEKERERG